MNITLHGNPIKTGSELKVGEHGFCRACGGVPSLSTPLYPIMTPPMGDCYRATRVDDGTLDVEFVPAVDHQSVAMDEIVVTEVMAIRFEHKVRELQQKGWRVDTGSLYVTHGNGMSVCMALMHREARGE